MPLLLLGEVGPPIPLPLTSVGLWTASISSYSSSPLLSSLDICPTAVLLVMLAPQQQTRAGGKTRSKNTHNHLRNTKEHAKSFKKTHLSTTTTQKEVP